MWCLRGPVITLQSELIALPVAGAAAPRWRAAERDGADSESAARDSDSGNGAVATSAGSDSALVIWRCVHQLHLRVGVGTASAPHDVTAWTYGAGVGEASPLCTLAGAHAAAATTWAQKQHALMVTAIETVLAALALQAGATAHAVLADLARVAQAADVHVRAAVFGVETAVLDALAHALGWSFAAVARALLPAVVADVVSHVDGAVGADSGRWPQMRSANWQGALHGALATAVVVDSVAEVETALASGYRTFKVKLGRDTERDVAHIGALMTAAQAQTPATVWRADANAGWSASSVAARVAQLARLPLRLQFIEEPAAEWQPFLAAQHEVPFAIDEGLGAFVPAWATQLAAAPAVHAFVAKPTVIGGIVQTLAWAHVAAATGKTCLVTHALEGPIGTAACAETAMLTAAWMGGASTPNSEAALDFANHSANHPALAAGLGNNPTLTPVHGTWSVGVHQLAHVPWCVAHAGIGLGYTGCATLTARLALVGAGVVGAGAVARGGVVPRVSVAAQRGAGDPKQTGTVSSGQPETRDSSRLPSAVAAAALRGARAEAGLGAALHWRSDDTAFDIFAVAARTPHALACVFPDQTLTFAAAAHLVQQALDARKLDTRFAAIADTSLATLVAIWAAFASKRPLFLVHEKLALAQQQRLMAQFATAQLPAEAALVIATSGSTGSPRLLVHSAQSIASAVRASAVHLGWHAADRWLLALPLSHAGGLAVVLRCLAAHKPIVVAARTDAILPMVERHAVTLLSLVPAQLTSLVGAGAVAPASVRAVLMGGAATPRKLRSDACALGWPVLTTYGATETFGQVVTAPLAVARQNYEGVGVPLPGVDLHGHLRAAASPQPIQLTTAQAAIGEIGTDGGFTAWSPPLDLPDAGFVDSQGMLHLVGRLDDVFIAGGENVQPQAIEDLVMQTPGVRAVVAVAVPDERFGQLPAVIVQVDASFAIAVATAHWQAELPPYARPRFWLAVDALPLNATGKVDRRAAAALPGLRRVRYRGE